MLPSLYLFFWVEILALLLNYDASCVVENCFSDIISYFDWKYFHFLFEYIYIYIYVLKFVGAVRCSTEVVNQYGKQILCCLCHFPCRLDN